MSHNMKYQRNFLSEIEIRIQADSYIISSAVPRSYISVPHECDEEENNESESRNTKAFTGQRLQIEWCTTDKNG